MLKIRRIILFTTNMPAMSAFYRDVVGLRPFDEEEDWKDFDAGSCRIALHLGKSAVGSRPPKLVFFAADVPGTRAKLIERGAATMGKIYSTDTFQFCDGADPDGNPFQISSRP